MKSILLRQFCSNVNSTAWYVTLVTALDGVTEQQALWKNETINNSIFQIVDHLLFWNNQYLCRFKGIAPPPMVDHNNATFENPEQLNWKTTVDKLFALMAEWDAAIAGALESKLEGPVSEKNKDSWYSVIANLNTHTAYHIGQIVLIRKLQGSWNPEKGVS